MYTWMNSAAGWMRMHAGSVRGGLISKMMLIVALTATNGGVNAQGLQLMTLQGSAAGGSGTAEGFTLYSSLGTAAPAGTAQNGALSVAGGGISLLKVDEVSTIAFQHEPMAEATAGEDITVSGTLDADERIWGATLSYRRGGSVEYKRQEMSVSGAGIVSADIPGEDVTAEGLVYFFEFRRPGNHIVRFPETSEFGISVRVEDPGFISDRAFPGGSDQSAYRIISVPLFLDDPDPEAIFGDELGDYNPDVWRFFELRFDQSTREHPNTSPVEPGRGFWMITSQFLAEVSSGPGVSVNPANAFTIPLHPAWNLIGNPFHHPIPVSNLRLRSGERLELRSFEGFWNDPIGDRVTILEPGVGYALFSASSAVDTLEIDPRPNGNTKQSGSEMKGVAAAGPGKSGSSATIDLDWSIRIEARSGRSVDRDNIVGVAPDAVAGMDGFDFREPPSMASDISVYFSRPEWSKGQARFSSDIRPPNTRGEEWEFDIEAQPGNPVTVTFHGIDRVPSDLDVVLYDELLEVATNLRQSPTYSLSGGTAARRFKLMVGTREFIAEAGERLEMIPTSVELDPVFPNPVSSAMSIRYGLPRAAHVSLRIYDATGRLIQEVYSGARDAGRHVYVWENGGGSATLASGVYLMELEADGRRLVKTFTVVR